MSLPTDEDMKSELERNFGSKTIDIPTKEAYNLEEILLEIGFTSKEENLAKVLEGNVGYYIVLTAASDRNIEQALEQLGFEKSQYNDLWIKESGADQVSENRYIKVLSSIINGLTDQILDKMQQIGEICLANHQAPIFEASSQSLRFGFNLKTIVIGRDTLHSFIETLYKNLWEASDDGKRFKSLSLSSDDLKILTILRELRHHQLHNREYNSENDKVEKYKRMKRIIKKYIGKSIPTSTIDYINIQRSLLKDINSLLKNVISSLLEMEKL